jgi:hypothetical protein
LKFFHFNRYLLGLSTFEVRCLAVGGRQFEGLLSERSVLVGELVELRLFAEE